MRIKKTHWQSDDNSDGLFFYQAPLVLEGQSAESPGVRVVLPVLLGDALDQEGKGVGGSGAGGKGGGKGGRTDTGDAGGGSTDTGTTGSTSGSGGTSTGGGSRQLVHWTLAPPTGDSTLPTDTSFGQQWALTSAKAGINVTGVWQNYTGAGIKVGVIDNGIDYLHSDLSAHYLSDLDYDTVAGDADAYYARSADYHGTNVAGVIGADRNGSGIVGIAYDAGIAAYRIGYAGTAGSTSDPFVHALDAGMDVVNNSWGYSTPFADNFGTTGLSSIRDAVALGREGLGMNIVFSAGNYASSGDDVNYHNYKNSPYVITVAGTDGSGKILYYSSPGAAVLVSAPGQGILTDDLSGTDGKSSGDFVMNSGTSFAAPHVSGIIALMLQANPLLGFRDVEEILAYSARNSDPANSGWATNGATNWNGGGLHFSHDYGFGLVDAFAAVRLAESWQFQSTYANLSTIAAVHSDNTAIPDGAGSLRSTIRLDGSIDIDRIVVDLNISHALASDLTVTLTSPAGTTATLIANPANGVGGGIVFSTTADNFWGEDTKGDWTLTVSDSVAGNTGTLNSWTLKALGDAATAPTVYVYTDEFATVTGASRFVLHDTSGTAGINTAAVTSASTIDLNPGAYSTIAGKQVQIDSQTVIKTLWSGDGNDTITGNDTGNTIQAARGNDTIYGGAGIDTLFGGPGDDYVSGGAGGDTLWGEAGNDVFVYGAGDGVDRIVDFAHATDVIQISGYTSAQVQIVDGADCDVVAFLDAAGTWIENASIQVSNVKDLTTADLLFV